MKCPLIVCVGAFAVASLAVAGATGRLSGTVRDAKGAPLPGATVTVASPTQIGGARVAVTDAAGSFAFPNLTPGVFSIKVELAGFVTEERSEVQVRLDHTTELDASMALGRFAEEVRVVAETPMVDPTQVSTSQTFTAEYMRNAQVGSAQRSYQYVLGQAAGVVWDGGDTHVFGSTIGENACNVDGLDTTDPATATFGMNLAFDAIQEISFQTGGFEAEYGRATGGVVNVITKSGGNDFSGSLDYRYRSTSFYQNGDHFNRDTNPLKFTNPAITFGGPILRDKLWFFVSGEFPAARNTPAGSPSTREFKGAYYLGKLTWQISPSWRAIVKMSGDPADIDNANAGPAVAPEATAFQHQGNRMLQGEMDSVLTPNLLWSLQVGYNRAEVNGYPQSGDLATPGHFDYLTGYAFVNYAYAEYSTRDRDEFKTDLTWLKVGWGGSHDFKFGLVYDRTAIGIRGFTPGGWSFLDWPENPYTPTGSYAAYENTDPGALDFPGRLYGAYVQDAWRPAGSVTVKIGVRWDGSKFENDVGEAIPTLDKLQPRLGIAWDITADAKNTVSASWARFMHPSALTLPSEMASRASTTSHRLSCSYFMARYASFGFQTCEDLANALLGSADIVNDPVDFDPLGWFLFAIYSSSSSRIASSLKPTYADEWQVSFQRELAHRTAMTLSYTDKKTRDIFEDTCNGNWPTADANGACDHFIIANLGDNWLERNYKGASLSFETRASDWIHLLASYTWSESKGSIEYTQNVGSDFDVYPSYYQNRYGWLSDDRRHRVKLNGYVLLPAGFTIGVNSYWSSPFAWTPQSPGAYGSILAPQFDEPRGSRRANANYQVDLQLSWAFKAAGLRASLIGAVVNALGTEAVTAVCQPAEGCITADGDAVAQGGATAWQAPRAFEAGFRIEL